MRQSIGLWRRAISLVSISFTDFISNITLLEFVFEIEKKGSAIEKLEAERWTNLQNYYSKLPSINPKDATKKLLIYNSFL